MREKFLSAKREPNVLKRALHFIIGPNPNDANPTDVAAQAEAAFFDEVRAHAFDRLDLLPSAEISPAERLAYRD